MLALFGLALVVIIIICFIGKKKRELIQKIRAEFENKYGCNLPSYITIDNNDSDNTKKYYYLQFPHWFYYNKNGTKDNRRKNNGIAWGVCRLHLENYTLSCKNPFDMVDYVNYLRDNNGIQIDKNSLEIKKENALLKEQRDLSSKKSIYGIINRFSPNPTDFEEFCAKLYRKMGYKAETTPPTNDGGYDVKIVNDYDNAIVECKCYALTNKIGRPLIQKLVGANQTELADRMIFITTSSFTSSAIKYADEVGVELIDGNKLVEMCNKYIYNDNTSTNTKSKINFSLCAEDFSEYIAEDLLPLVYDMRMSAKINR